ncbi:MAG: polysaccharide biosynthesis protein [Legionellaceae bacterium]|nr:polysaccharide biosynthesis protein [Legionellaceae bacterium]
MHKSFEFPRKLLRKMPVLSYDLGGFLLSWYLAYGIRFNLEGRPQSFLNPHFFMAMLTVFFISTACYYYFRVYRGFWRFSSINDVINIIKSQCVTLCFAIPVLYFFSLSQSIPRTIFILYPGLVIALQCGGRLCARLFVEHPAFRRTGIAKQKVLVIGAGAAGEHLLRDLQRSQQYKAVALLDDMPAKKGLSLRGIRVLGPVRDVCQIARQTGAQLIFIAIASASSSAMRRMITYCEKTNLPIRTLPGLTALASGRVTVDALRAVKIEDLLGRDQVKLDWDSIGASLLGKRIAVSGGGGSIGAELCRQIIAQRPEKILILDHSEYNLYQIDLELRTRYPDSLIELALISITDRPAVEDCFQRFQPDMVFHAAAYKHVPLLENQIRVAVRNNIIGTQIVAEAAVAVGAKHFILISTDKAVNPTNIMGSSKRIAEMYCQNLNQRVPTRFTTIRFGNVLGSAGSVVPLFTRQLQQGGPLTVTHPEIERFFMTIPEACQLILQAMVNGEGGEIFVLDMGEPIKIRYLAEQMIRLAGKEPEKDIPIVYTGLRPGEKLYEELFHESESLAPTCHDKLFKARFRHIDWERLMASMHNIQHYCELNEEQALLEEIQMLVPEFRPAAALVASGVA